MNLVGTGPMELTDLVEDSSVTWRRVPDYWGEISLGMEGLYTTVVTRLWVDQDLKRELGF